MLKGKARQRFQSFIALDLDFLLILRNTSWCLLILKGTNTQMHTHVLSITSLLLHVHNHHSWARWKPEARNSIMSPIQSLGTHSVGQCLKEHFIRKLELEAELRLEPRQSEGACRCPFSRCLDCGIKCSLCFDKCIYSVMITTIKHLSPLTWFHFSVRTHAVTLKF